MENLRPTAAHAGLRLDQYLTAAVADVSRARIQLLIAQGKVHVNGKSERASYRVRGDEVISLLAPPHAPPLNATPQNIPLDVVFEDDSFAVVNKPAGMMVHAGAGPSLPDEGEEGDLRTNGTLVNALLYRFKDLSHEGGNLRPGIVHRLDKETSGLIVIAKNDSAHRRLAEQFAARKVKKTYLALVHGWPKQANGTINAAIGRDPVRRNRMSTRARDGREAVSHYHVRQTFDTHFGKFALLEVRIDTGRTHQIRVHLASIGHPVVGDQLYGAPDQITPLDSARPRARPANTKATRDRAATELARRLTEAAMEGKRSRRGKGGGATPSAAPGNVAAPSAELAPLTLHRNFLHAAALELEHPRTGQPMTFRKELPPELSGFLERLTHLTR